VLLGGGLLNASSLLVMQMAALPLKRHIGQRRYTMKLVQILLPVRDNHGRKFKRALYSKLHRELVLRFGGLTAHARSPAHGLWTSEGSTKRDDMIIMEVMTKRFDRRWWKKYRRSLERAFRQEEIVIRAHNIIQV
jgi:hypothetical protein